MQKEKKLRGKQLLLLFCFVIIVINPRLFYLAYYKEV